MRCSRMKVEEFQHTAARRRLEGKSANLITGEVFQHTAARRRLGRVTGGAAVLERFNTQPPN